VDSLFRLVRAEYSGERALETTAYVGQRWRLPGNTGFDESIEYVRKLLEKAGFREEQQERLSYRVERRTMEAPAWEPLTGQVQIAGQNQPLLTFAENRNMITINSFSTPEGGIEAPLVYVAGCDSMAFDTVEVENKIVFAECHCYPLFREAVQKRGAAGVLGYRIPGYNQPERYTNSIPFTSIPLDSARQSWAINLSYRAKETLKAQLEQGPVRLRVNIETRLHQSEELTLVAELRGSRQPEERFVFSAHVQEPGANDNASGVACLAEMARSAAALLQRGDIDPGRTITFLWGDEISSTRRFVTEDTSRQKNIRYGISLDMVGEDTEKTGGVFLIEKMPDPSAIWTRGEDRHTEWGATPVSKADLDPHYFNDFIFYICQQQGEANNWTVRTNPFEGGSDHVPFLRAGIPGLLLWHFTDAFYHTDADRIDKVSPETLYNVGVSALVSALTLCRADNRTAVDLVRNVEAMALQRLNREWLLSRNALRTQGSLTEQRDILWTWGWWYSTAIQKMTEIPVGGATEQLQKLVEQAARGVEKNTIMLMEELEY